MRTGVVFVLTAVLVCPPAWAADYEVPVSGTLAKAIAAANANTDGDTYEIEIAGSSADSGTVRKSASITGDSTARLSGSLTFTGTGVKSALDNLSFTAGSGTAVTNGTLGFGEAQDLTVNNVSFSQRTGGYYGGAFANLGNTEINGSSFTGNRGNLGGALFAEGKLTLDTSEGNILFSGNTASNINEGGEEADEKLLEGHPIFKMPTTACLSETLHRRREQLWFMPTTFSAARTPLPKARFCILPAMPPSTTCGCKPAAGWICAGRDLLPPTL